VSPAPGETFLLAGKSWRVAALDEEGAALLVVPAPGGAAPVFLGGGAEMHGRVARRMRELLEGEATFSFVDDTGARLLEEARDACRSFPLPLVPLGDERTAWLPFTGSRAMETLRAMLAASGWMATGRRAALILPLPEGRARKAIDDAAEHLGDPARLAAHVRPRRRRKHDPLLDDELLVISIERDGLDLEGAREALEIRQ
jgi:ATP-dependent Lhr-like helicase